jgi:hypothetical protein
MSKLLQALQQKFASPQEACEALGLDPAAVLPAQARYDMAADAKSLTDKATGETYSSHAFTRALFDTNEDEMYTTLQRRLARDADLPAKAGLAGDPKTMVGNGDQDDPINGGPTATPSKEDLLAMMKLVLAGLSPEDQNSFISELVAAVSGPGGIDGAPDNNKGALDRRRAGARDKRPALDSNVRALNHPAFLLRFPFLPARDGWR